MEFAINSLTRFVQPFAMLLLAALALTGCNNAGLSPESESTTKIEEPAGDDQQSGTANDTLDLVLKDGTVVITMRPDLAPNHVKQIQTLVSKGFYDGIVFHRVIDGFMAQTGDPTGTGSGGSELPDIKAEFSTEPFKRGTVGMARAASPDSANSQFFIMFDAGDFLNGKYTIIGQVTSGMEFIDKIKRGEGQNGLVTDPDKIIRMEFANQ